MKYAEAFKMPKSVTIMARTSSITNSFVNGIIPCIVPNEDEIRKTLLILGMDKDDVRCAYCGDKSTEWDHFRPLVKDKQPTGYITEINNLVPACGKCNQSKGNKNWKDWMLSDATLSPKSRNIPNLDLLISRLSNFEKQSKPIKIDIQSVIGEELWTEHWSNCEKLHKQMKDSQMLSDKIKKLLNQNLNKSLVLDNQRISINNSSELALEISNNSIEFEVLKIQNSFDETDFDLRELKVGVIAQNNLRNLLESNSLSEDIIVKLQDLDYCKEVFDINFPVLLKYSAKFNEFEQIKDHLGRNRYYSKPIYISGVKYFLTSQWYERNKVKLIRFIEYFRY